ncbi:glutamate-5-semialdehyde dehydrogenase [Ferruginivarius sediminum]|uniref:Gamma-glutamyl phosphate reductase n=1 Tax=Ferruginivarius sediminum TaxID=2661937 RepID=A0A369T6Y8_9PROT|nr:glutamate-5-semialdehyde dehydrogenase [Ferruginivarius sediminum]RDD61093.1 glutamate-5-semialdehyde dehydrogenase [Ferruginivarius sediminum]
MSAAPAQQSANAGRLYHEMIELGETARAASHALAVADGAAKDKALKGAAAALRRRTDEVLDANAKDVEGARSRDLSAALLDRLELSEQRIEAMAAGLEAIAELPDPVGRTLAEWERPNGLKIARVAVPIGVIGIIYESRPNVTADAAGLCLKSGNAAILRGGSESYHSAAVIVDCVRDGLAAAGLPEACVQRVPTTDRDAVGLMLGMDKHIDVIVPRGGKSLIQRVREESRMPVLAHLEGINHTYVQASIDPELARRVVFNAKMRRPGICGATEKLLVDRAALTTHLPGIVDDLLAAGCELRGDESVCGAEQRMLPARPEDWDMEYLAPILAVKMVDGVNDAIAHINRHGSGHTEAILTGDTAAAEKFCGEVDAAIVMVNASTQFADGGEFGMGAEIGIATGKMPPRGPVGAAELTSYKYVVHGSGQTRP